MVHKAQLGMLALIADMLQWLVDCQSHTERVSAMDDTPAETLAVRVCVGYLGCAVHNVLFGTPATSDAFGQKLERTRYHMNSAASQTNKS